VGARFANAVTEEGYTTALCHLARKTKLCWTEKVVVSIAPSQSSWL
jgi:hypothetical protein